MRKATTAPMPLENARERPGTATKGSGPCLSIPAATMSAILRQKILQRQAGRKTFSKDVTRGIHRMVESARLIMRIRVRPKTALVRRSFQDTFRNTVPLKVATRSFLCDMSIRYKPVLLVVCTSLASATTLSPTCAVLRKDPLISKA